MSMRPNSSYGLENHGVMHPNDVYWTLTSESNTGKDRELR